MKPLFEAHARPLHFHPFSQQLLGQSQFLPLPWPRRTVWSPCLLNKQAPAAAQHTSQPRCQPGDGLALHILCCRHHLLRCPRLQNTRQDGRRDGCKSHQLIEVDAAALQLVCLISHSSQLGACETSAQSLTSERGQLFCQAAAFASWALAAARMKRALFCATKSTHCMTCQPLQTAIPVPAWVWSISVTMRIDCPWTCT